MGPSFIYKKLGAQHRLGTLGGPPAKCLAGFSVSPSLWGQCLLMVTVLAGGPHSPETGTDSPAPGRIKEVLLPPGPWGTLSHMDLEWK